MDYPAPASAFDLLAPTVFHQPWWLEIATGGMYETAEVSVGGKIVGRMPYHLHRRFGLTMCHMPTMTHFLGPGIDEGEGSANQRFLKRLNITRELIEKLPPVASINMKCHRGISETIAFQELDFKTSVQFTHEIAPDTDAEQWKSLRDKTRNVIRRARETLAVSTAVDPDEFMRFYHANLYGRGVRTELAFDTCAALVAASVARDCGKVFAVRDRNGKLLAAIFCVWDRSTYFYLMSTRRVDSGNGAISLLLWEAIRDAAQRNLIFDFDGLHNRGSILFFAGFGAKVSPRYIVARAQLRFRVLNELRYFRSAQRNYFW